MPSAEHRESVLATSALKVRTRLPLQYRLPCRCVLPCGGIRIGILDGHLGVLRIDLATGLTDRRTAMTVGWHQGWPPFRVSGERD
jgi:hypothetical protein